jgi:hypothetical protein
MYFKEDYNEPIAYCEAMGLSKVFAEYAEHWSKYSISMVGFNENYGNVFIWIEDAGVSIASCMGQSIHYVYYDYQLDEELEFNSYRDYIIYTESN